MKEITVKELSKKYKKSKTYFSTILCRPEFNQFYLNFKTKKGKYVFDDCINFHKMLVFFMERKYR